MRSERWIAGAGIVLLLAVVLAILPGIDGEQGTAGAQVRKTDPNEKLERMQEKLQAEIAALQAQLEQKMAELQRHRLELDEGQAEKLAAHAEEYARMAEQLAQEHSQQAEEMARAMAEKYAQFGQDFTFFADEEESGWLGVSVEEVTADRAKELKLPAQRGVYLSEVNNESPAAKAGLKTGDVITEFNGQRLEGTVQFRRMVRETPAGRAVQLTVWRDGRAQAITATLGSPREVIEQRFKSRLIEPREFSFAMPRIEVFAGRGPTIGIQGDDLSGQLGTYFGAPEGEGVLVREVVSGSPAEKAGLKAGDVITKVDGARIHSTSELRAKLRENREKSSVTLSVIRNRAETSVNVEIEKPKPPEPRRPGRVVKFRTAI